MEKSENLTNGQTDDKAIGLFCPDNRLASGAWAACPSGAGSFDPGTGQLEVCVVGGPSYAGEISATGSDDVVLSYMDTEEVEEDSTTTPPTICMPEDTNGPKVVIELPATVTAGALLTGDAEIIYTLHGAVFAERVSNTALVAKHHQAASRLV